jgi:hypothetical protein
MNLGTKHLIAPYSQPACRLTQLMLTTQAAVRRPTPNVDNSATVRPPLPNIDKLGL